MNNQQYHADTSRISKSGLDLIHRSPAHYYAKYLDPNRPTFDPDPFSRNAKKEGQLIHCIVFEPEKVTKEFAIIPGGLNLRKNEDKDKLARFYSRHINKVFVHQDEFEKALQIKASVYSHPMALTLINSGKYEEVIHWTCPDTGIKCKSRLDCNSKTPSGLFIGDLKTTENASTEAFGKSVWNYRYHVQGAFYAEAFYQKYKRPIDGFIFIAVEKEAPFAVNVQYLTEEHFAMGKNEYIEDLLIYKNCIETGEFPGYSQEVTAVKLPGYAYKRSA